MVSLRTSNLKLREFMAEFLGTLALTCLGCCANAVIRLRQLESESDPSLLSGTVAWSLAVSVGIFISNGVSGGHLNPAVSVGLASVGKFHWKKLTHYLTAQYLGAFFGSLLTYIVYQDNLNKYDRNLTMGIFGTEMQENITLGTAMIDQILATSFFLLIVCAITDERNHSMPKGLIPIAIGFVNIGALAMAFGYNCGGPMNPARDLSPRILSAVVGWGQQVFYNGHHYYFWVPILACHIGGVIGCWTYRLMIENHWPRESYEMRSLRGSDETDNHHHHNNNNHSNHNNAAGMNSPGIRVTDSQSLELTEA